ncbi:MAG TPA: type II toxin-antitoxin system Phd/YefM family antitoxin [Terracidiphilus sp.]|nr:type II toxin-antitoxin system Phd/YefM family antitoxin [Terracidiphilus sp.]
MAITTITSRQFNQDTSRAKKAAKKGPVIITDRGRPAHVLLTIEEFKKLKGKKSNIAELLAMPGAGDVEFDPPRLGNEAVRAADFS